MTHPPRGPRPVTSAATYRRRRVGALALVTVAVIVIGFAVVRLAGSGGASGVDAAGAGPTGQVGATAGASGATATTLAPTTRARRVLKLAFTGDTLIHSLVYNQAKTYGARSGLAYDFAPMYDKVRAQLSAADLAICHQETPLTADDKTVSGYPVFSTPHEIADALKGAGYDGCSTASNHSFDRNLQGITDTVGVFEQVGLKQSGMARTPEEAARPTIYSVNGVTIAHLAYSYGLNGFTLPADKQYVVRLITKGKESLPDQPYSSQTMLADARAARAAGANVVIISVQWGQEYQAKPTPAQVQLANELLASPDIDLVIGHHVHVIQPIDKIGAKYVVYGLGNFISNQSPAADPSLPAGSQDGVIVEVTLTEGPADGVFTTTKVAYTPTWVDRNGYVITPVATALKDASVPAASRAALTESWQRTTTAINALGAGDKYGVVPTATP